MLDGMANYRRYFQPGGTYFFTVVTFDREPLFKQPLARELLHVALAEAKQRWPFEMPAVVLLPDHLHDLWSLPPGDDRYAIRWGWNKKEFTKRWLEAGGREQPVSAAKQTARRRGVWQRRYWEHLIHDEDDFERHFDYIHYNPVKHGYVKCPKDWPYSSFHRWVTQGVVDENWACGDDQSPMNFDDIKDTAIE